MTPRVVAKSGMVITLLSRAMRALPMPMPARATPMGRPIASTEPKARIRMTMAKARPSTSEDGRLELAEVVAAELDAEPVDGRGHVLDVGAEPSVLGPMSEPSSTRAKATCPASSPDVAVWPEAGRGVGADDLDAGLGGDAGEVVLHRRPAPSGR